MNIQNDEIYCHCCMRWVSIYTEILVFNDIDVVCMRCYPEHYIHLGYIWDVPQFADTTHEAIGD